MNCPSCGMRELALAEAVRRKGGFLTVPADVDRLWCPACGFVSDRPKPKPKKVESKKVPRGTSKKALKRAKGGRK